MHSFVLFFLNGVLKKNFYFNPKTWDYYFYYYSSWVGRDVIMHRVSWQKARPHPTHIPTDPASCSMIGYLSSLFSNRIVTARTRVLTANRGAVCGFHEDTGV